MLLLILAAVSCLLSASYLGAAVNGKDVVGVSMCCPEGEVLKLELLGPGGRHKYGLFYSDYTAKCVRNRRSPKDTLDGATITVTGDDDGEKQMVVKKTGVMLPSCPLALKMQSVSLNSSENSGSYQRGPYYREEPKTGIHMTTSGQLTIPGLTRTGLLAPTTYNTGEFCMAGVWESVHVRHGPMGLSGPKWSEVDAIALVCEPCKSKILCGVNMGLFSSLANVRTLAPYDGQRLDFQSSEIVACEELWCQTCNNIVHAFDEDGDAKVNFEEFKSKIEKYVEKVFNFLDLNGEGSLDEVSFKNLSLKLFLDVLDEIFTFFDVNQDHILSVEDAFRGWSTRFSHDAFRIYHDGKYNKNITIREVFGVTPLNLPAPLYVLYTTLDKEKDEKITLEEATNFIKGTFYVIDQNEDCSINIDEIIATLKESNLPEDFQLAVKLLGDYYFTLADYFLNKYVSAADVDGDKKTTLAEIIGVKDPAVIESIVKVAVSMGKPNTRITEFLFGRGRLDGSWMGREEREGVVEMWLNVLSDFANNKKYDSVPNNLCGFE